MYICIRTLFMIYVYIVLCYIKFPCFVPCIQSGQYFGVSLYIYMYVHIRYTYIYIYCTYFALTIHTLIKVHNRFSYYLLYDV